MNKFEIDIPEGITYLGDYPGLTNQLPQNSSYILNKVLTGCGATTMFLKDQILTVLCSPRRELIRSKSESNEFQGKVYLFDREIDTYGQEKLEYKAIETRKADLDSYLQFLSTNPFFDNSYVPKILVTYDSTKHVIKKLEEYGMLDKFRFVVDEFQTIFTDAGFRGEIIIEFMQYLRQANQVVFLSATPYIEEYLEMLPEFAGLPYVELLWPQSAIPQMFIQKRTYISSPRQTINLIIGMFYKLTC